MYYYYMLRVKATRAFRDCATLLRNPKVYRRGGPDEARAGQGDKKEGKEAWAPLPRQGKLIAIWKLELNANYASAGSASVIWRTSRWSSTKITGIVIEGRPRSWIQKLIHLIR